MNDSRTTPVEAGDLLAVLESLARQSEQLPAADTPAGNLMRQFLHNTWSHCREQFLPRTKLLRVWPEVGSPPRVFRFELLRPYKRKLGTDAPVELVPGPIRGTIHYRADMFSNPRLPYIAVQIDPELGYFHPNCSRRRGSLVCLGEIPANAFPFPLATLLENHVYPILTYQNRRPAHPFDEEAARYFALEPSAMDGLESVEPLY
ncbi:MAG: hypothetical protein J5I93_11955 [Pirellulaceae bacterium]|nr:hypothetical protein [Pirellulaceae bacterium]